MSNTNDSAKSLKQDSKTFFNDPQDDSVNINSKHFDEDAYIQKSIKEKSLKYLLEEESSLVNEIQRLDSECQTLVYDHYDKFIAATDIVKQMKEGSSEMSTQVGRLQENMTLITESSQEITKDLQVRRDNLSHHLGIHGTLQKLQFLFMLPNKINECIREEKFAEGVRCYLETSEVLQKYSHLPSFVSIYSDCQLALAKLNAALKNQLSLNEGSARHLTLCVDLLLQLGEPAEGLYDDFLAQARSKLEEDLNDLESLALTNTQDRQYDILQFIDICHDTFVANLWLVISSYKEMFLRNLVSINQSALEKLTDFVTSLVDSYIAIVNIRIECEDSKDFWALTTALDKFHRRLHAISQLLPNTDFSEKSLCLIIDAAQARCQSTLKYLNDTFTSSLTDVRQSLVTSKPIDEESSIGTQLNELLTTLVASTAANIKDSLHELLAFNQPKHTFAMQLDFRTKFCRDFVREGLIVKFFHQMTLELQGFCHKQDKDPVLLLLLSRMCLDLHTSSVHYLLNNCDEQLQIEDKTGLTSLKEITSEMLSTGKLLLNQYVHLQGSNVSQLLRRSVELKDWIGCSEPRSVRKVMKTVKTEIALMDTQVGALYEEGQRKEMSSDSSRRTYHSVSTTRMGRSWGGYSSTMDDSLVANLTKLWSERIEIFSPVEFTRTSILTGIVKISLKTLLESVRLRTLGRFGFQQVQLDTHFLRTYLWPYVADEHEVVVPMTIDHGPCDLLFLVRNFFKDNNYIRSMSDSSAKDFSTSTPKKEINRSRSVGESGCRSKLPKIDKSKTQKPERSHSDYDTNQFQSVSTSELHERLHVLASNPLVSSNFSDSSLPNSRDRSRERRSLNKSPLLPRLQARLYNNAPLKRRRTLEHPYSSNTKLHSASTSYLQSHDNSASEESYCQTDKGYWGEKDNLLDENIKLREENEKLLAEIEKMEEERKLYRKEKRKEVSESQNEDDDNSEKRNEQSRHDFSLADTLTENKLDFLRKDLQMLQLEGAVLKERLTSFQTT